VLLVLAPLSPPFRPHPSPACHRSRP
jgi:hypothetical protein